MAADASSAEDDELITAINVTPLVDVVLVLLIILMVTASYLVKQAINVELPKAATGEATDASLSISLDKDGKTYLDGNAVDVAELPRRFKQAKRVNPNVKAIISADGRVRHAHVVHVIDLLRREHINRFAINTSPLELEH
ncbi:MAG: biopolymer transporter ExbD [Proteobacteria bacterium]|nr:biopolymer transporter ExbD [Pseudomonadota bacterium]